MDEKLWDSHWLSSTQGMWMLFNLFFHVLQLTPFIFTQQNSWCISISTTKHMQKLDWKLDLPLFTYGSHKCMFVDYHMLIASWAKKKSSLFFGEIIRWDGLNERKNQQSKCLHVRSFGVMEQLNPKSTWSHMHLQHTMRCAFCCGVHMESTWHPRVR